jgi:MFS family permease
MLMMEWTGILTITVYANVLFTQAGFDPTKAAWLSGLCNTTGIFATAAAALTVDRIGRRMSMYIGFIIQAITMFLTGGFARLQVVQPQHSVAYGAAAAAMVFIYTWAFAQTVLQVAFIYPAEIWPTSVRAKGNAFGVAGWAIGRSPSPLQCPLRPLIAFMDSLLTFRLRLDDPPDPSHVRQPGGTHTLRLRRP